LNFLFYQRKEDFTSVFSANPPGLCRKVLWSIVWLWVGRERQPLRYTHRHGAGKPAMAAHTDPGVRSSEFRGVESDVAG
jgi:hypothetical protein